MNKKRLIEAIVIPHADGELYLRAKVAEARKRNEGEKGSLRAEKKII